MNRNQQAALMQQKVMSAAGLNNNNLSGGQGQIQSGGSDYSNPQSRLGSTGQTIVNGVLKGLFLFSIILLTKFYQLELKAVVCHTKNCIHFHNKFKLVQT